jgi:hypothetical protein
LQDHIAQSAISAWVGKLRDEGVTFRQPYQLGDTRAVMIEARAARRSSWSK